MLGVSTFVKDVMTVGCVKLVIDSFSLARTCVRILCLPAHSRSARARWKSPPMAIVHKGSWIDERTIYRSFVPHRKRKRLGSSTSLSGKNDGRQPIMNGNQICGGSFS